MAIAGIAKLLAKAAKNPKIAEMTGKAKGLAGKAKQMGSDKILDAAGRKETLADVDKLFQSGKIGRDEFLKRRGKANSVSSAMSDLMAEGELRAGMNAGESPFRAFLARSMPKSAAGDSAASMMGGKFGKSVEHNLGQMAGGAVSRGVVDIAKSAPGIAGKGLGLAAKAGKQAAMLPLLPARAGMAGAAGAARIGSAAGGALAGAGDVFGSEDAAKTGEVIKDTAGKVADSFKAIAKNPINPMNFARLAKALAELPNKFAKLGESLVLANEKLAPFSAQMAMASAEFKMDEVRRNIKSAQNTGTTSRQMADSVSNLKDELRPIQDLLKVISNVIVTKIADILAFIFAVINKMTELFVTFVDAVLSAPFMMWVPDETLDKWKEVIKDGIVGAEKEKNPMPLGMSLGKMRDNFSSARTMNKSSMGDWTVQTNNGTRADGTLGGGFQSPVDPNSDLKGVNNMGGNP